MDTSRRWKLEDKHRATQEAQDIQRLAEGRGRQDLAAIGQDDRRGHSRSRSQRELAEAVAKQEEIDERGPTGIGPLRPADE